MMMTIVFLWRPYQTTAIIKGAATKHDDLMSTLTRGGTRHSDCLEEPFDEQMVENGNFVDDGRSPRGRLPPMPENGAYWGGDGQAPYEPGDQMAEYQPMGNHFHSLIQQDYHGKGFLPPIMESPASTYKGDSTQGTGGKAPVDQAEVATSMGDSFKGSLGLPPLGERPRPQLSDVVAFNLAIGGPPRVSKPAFHVLDDVTLEELAKSMPDEEPVADAENPGPATANANQTKEATPAVLGAEAEDVTSGVVIPDSKAIEDTRPSSAARQFQDQDAIDEPVEAVLANRPPSGGGDYSPTADAPDKNEPTMDSGSRRTSPKLKALQRDPSTGSRRGSMTARRASNVGSELPPPSPPTHPPDETAPASIRSQRPPGRRRSSAGSLDGERSHSAGSSRKNLGQPQSLGSSEQHRSDEQSEAAQDTAADATVYEEARQLTGIAALRQISMRRRSGSSEGPGSRKGSARLRQKEMSPQDEAAAPEDPVVSQHATAAGSAGRQEAPDVVEEAATSLGIGKEADAEQKEGRDEAMIEENNALQQVELPLAEEMIDCQSLQDDGDSTVDYLDQYEPDLEVPDQTEGEDQVPQVTDDVLDEDAIADHHDGGSEYDLEIPPAAASDEEHDLHGDVMLGVHEVNTSLQPEYLEPAADDDHLPEALDQDTDSNKHGAVEAPYDRREHDMASSQGDDNNGDVDQPPSEVGSHISNNVAVEGDAHWDASPSIDAVSDDGADTAALVKLPNGNTDDGASLPNGNSNADHHPELLTDHREAPPSDSSKPDQGSRGKAGTASSTLMDSDEISFGSVPNGNYRISQASDVPVARHEGLAPVLASAAPVSPHEEDGPADVMLPPSGNHQGVDSAGAVVDEEDSDDSESYDDDDDYEDDFEDMESSTKSLLPRTGSMGLTAEQQKKSSLPIWLQ